MSQADGAGPASVICNRLAEDRRIDQCFSPHGKSGDGPVVEDLDQLRMRDCAQHSVSHGADGVVHTFKKQALSIWPVAPKVNGKLLPTPIAQGVVTRNNTLQDNRRRLRLVALTNEVLARQKFSRPET